MNVERSYASVMANTLISRAKARASSDAFKPMELMTDGEREAFRPLSCAIAFNFYHVAKQQRDVIQHLGKGRYSRIGGTAPIAVRRKGRTEINFG